MKVPENVGASLAAWRERQRRVLERDCPACAIDSPTQRSCEFSAQEICRLRGELQRRRWIAEVEDELLQLGAGPAQRPVAALEQLPAIAWTPGQLWSPFQLERKAEGHDAYSPIQRLLSYGVPLRQVALALRQPRITEAVRFGDRLRFKEGILLVLSGNPGVGKSVAAAVVMLAHGGRGAWVRATDLARPPDDDAESVEHSSRGSWLLVLDDLGTEHSPSGYAASRICDLVELREAGMLATLITTNLDPESFRMRYGERIMSRINGDPLGWYDVAGDDQRITQPRLTVVGG